MEPYNQRKTVASTGVMVVVMWSARAYWVTAIRRKLRHLEKLEALRSRVVGMRDLTFLTVVACAQIAARGCSAAGRGGLDAAATLGEGGEEVRRGWGTLTRRR
jgi:hypothetical protein